MGNEGDKKAGPSSSHTPPPLDPFPTYQTSYPRNQNDEENPFVQFRRFADKQFNSFFTGLPQIFGFTTPDSFQKELQDMMKRRQEIQEGWRKQIEQEMEEMKQSYQKKRNDFEKPTSSRGPWWTRGDAAKCPALNQEQSDRALRCPAMYDQAGNPRTELDAYEHLKQVQNPDSMTTSENRPSEKSGVRTSALGYDGRRRLLKLQELMQEPENNIPQLHQWMMARPKRYTRFQTRNMDPVSDPQDIIPWLMLNSYSPAYLCNPNQARMFKVHIQQNEEVPMQIVKPRFCDARNPSELDHEMAKIPWADAFEDLVSLEQTGKMVERDYNTYRTPNTWIHDMVRRGSLGPKWGFDEDGKLTRKSQAVHQQIETVREVDVATNNDNVISEIEQPSWNTDREATEKLVQNIVDRIEEVERQVPGLSQLMYKIWHSPEDVLSAVTASTYEHGGREALETAVASEQKFTSTVQEENTPAPQEQTFSFSSNSSSAWNHDSSNDNADSVVSTMTKTESRTMPDGSVETRRVLRRRFADGREEGEETVDIQPAANSKTMAQISYNQPKTSADNHMNAFTPVQDEIKKQQKKGGWFWN